MQGACGFAEKDWEKIQGASKLPEECWRICKRLALFLKNLSSGYVYCVNESLFVSIRKPLAVSCQMFMSVIDFKRVP